MLHLDTGNDNLYVNVIIIVSDYSALFDSVYIAPKNADPFLWQVYPEPTLEYLRHGLITFQQKDTNPVLFTLITEV